MFVQNKIACDFFVIVDEGQVQMALEMCLVVRVDVVFVAERFDFGGTRYAKLTIGLHGFRKLHLPWVQRFANFYQ